MKINLFNRVSFGRVAIKDDDTKKALIRSASYGIANGDVDTYNEKCRKLTDVKGVADRFDLTVNPDGVKFKDNKTGEEETFATEAIGVYEDGLNQNFVAAMNYALLKAYNPIFKGQK